MLCNDSVLSSAIIEPVEVSLVALDRDSKGFDILTMRGYFFFGVCSSLLSSFCFSTNLCAESQACRS
jgi:hypothetical protein